MQLLTKSEKKLLLDSLEIHSAQLLDVLKLNRRLHLSDKAIVNRYQKINQLIKKIS